MTIGGPGRRRGRGWTAFLGFGGAVAAGILVVLTAGGASLRPAVQEGDAGTSPPLKTIAVPADAGWVDTGIDVLAGREIRFRSEGIISLQRGNPIAECGPAGLDLRTLQQPLPEWNLGALVGKVAQLISIKVDEESGEQVRDEIVRLFGIGRAAAVEMPLDGRLYLGVNESAFKDNSGILQVEIDLRGY